MSDLETDCGKNKESFSPRKSAASITTLSLLKKNYFSVKVFLQRETDNLILLYYYLLVLFITIY